MTSQNYFFEKQQQQKKHSKVYIFMTLNFLVLRDLLLWKWPQFKVKLENPKFRGLFKKHNQPLSEHEGWVHVGWGQPNHVPDFLGDHSQLLKVHKTIHTGVIAWEKQQCEYTGMNGSNFLNSCKAAATASSFSFL